MNTRERAELEEWIELIQQKAIEAGLDFYPIHFEIVPEHIIYELGSYGLPARFSHWTFGRDYHRQKTLYEYGLAKIYEIVFNTNPCQAFLMDSNSTLAHKFVIAHVLAHNDFFKNNVYFEHTDPGMIEKVRLHGNRIRKYDEEFGPQAVEDFLDSVLAIEEHFDATLTARFRQKPLEEYEADRRRPRHAPTPYDDIWSLTETGQTATGQIWKKTPPEPDKDLLGFLCAHGPDLEDWQRDIVEMIRDEMIYFIPQMRTKILNEGWASFWHERILTELPLTPQEHLEFRRMHSAVLSPGSRMSINPYYVGYTILRDIERRWNGEEDTMYPEENWRGEHILREPGKGLEKVFSVRQADSDVTFLRKYLTQGLVQKLDMYTYKLEEVDGERRWVVQDTNWEHVRDSLVDTMTNFGIPVIYVEDGDYGRRGELLLAHEYDGKPLDIDHTGKAMKHIHKLWGRPVHISTVVDDVPTLLTHDGEEFSQAPRDG